MSSLIDAGALIAELPIAVYVCEAPSGLIRYFNRRAAELWGREPAVGSTEERFCGSLRLFHADGRPMRHDETPMADTLRTGASRSGDVIVERPDGSRVTVAVSITALHDAGGRVIGAMNAFRDVTEERRREQAATAELAERREAEAAAARLAALVATAQDAIIGKTLDGVITSWNRAAERMFGYTAAEIVGQSIMRIVPDDRRDEELEIIAGVRRGEASERLESVRVARDGRRVPVALTISPVADAAGRVVGCSTIARDISERLRAEAELRRTVQTLEMLYHLADRVGRATGVTDVCEAAVDAVIGAGADRASVLVFDDAGVMRFCTWRNLSDDYRAAVDGHAPWDRDTPAPAPIVVSDVRTEPALATLRDAIVREGILALAFIPLVDQGRLLGKFMVYYDAPHAFSSDELRLCSTIAHHVAFGLARVQTAAAMTALFARERAAHGEAQAARAAAEHASRAKDEFLAMLAHELRNPLNVIVNAIAVVKAAAALSPEPERAATAIARQAKHLGHLLDDLLDVARITSGRIELAQDRLDLRSAVEHALEAQRIGIDARRQRTFVTMPDEPVVVLGDQIRLQQAVSNLLHNASKYTPAGGSIWVRVETAGTECTVRVRDDGAGIAPEHLETIFELFAQANPTLSRAEGGLGIGLTLVKRLIELHGGSVRAESDGPGKGAELIVRLPLANVVGMPAPQGPTAAPARRKRVLVVEDHDDGREMLAITLRMHGHDVLVAATGREGLDLAARRKVDVALLDIGLPDLDGYEVGRRLRASFGSRIRLVALTGYGQPKDRERSRQAGFDAHLVKPVDTLRLGQVLENLDSEEPATA
jgi:PAS domain S-box-containing protein